MEGGNIVARGDRHDDPRRKGDESNILNQIRGTEDDTRGGCDDHPHEPCGNRCELREVS
jgi:hypothetical protein